MNIIKKAYGICIKPCEILNRNSNKSEQIRQGDLIRILESNIDNRDKIVIKLYDSNKNCFKTDVFECDKHNISYVEEALWLHLIGAKDNDTRIYIYNERDLVLRLRCGSKIKIKTYENDMNANIEGVIQLIDTVKDVGIGNFIGLKLLKMPEKRDTVLCFYKKHFHSSTSLLLFRIEELIDAIKHEEQQQMSLPDLSKIAIKDTKEKAYQNEGLNVEAPTFTSLQSDLSNMKLSMNKLTNLIEIEQQRSICKDKSLTINSKVASLKSDNNAMKLFKLPIVDEVEQLRNEESVNPGVSYPDTSNMKMNVYKSSIRDDIVDNPVTYRSTNPFYTYENNPRSYESPKYENNREIDGKQLDKNKHNKTIIGSRSISYDSQAFDFMPFSSNLAPPQTAFFDYHSNSTNSPRSIDWRTISKPNNDLKENPISTAIKDLSASIEAENDDRFCSQSDQKSINEKGAIAKRNQPFVIKMNKGRYNKKKRKPNNRGFQTKSFYRNKTLRCEVCSSPFGRDTLVLRCHHCICVKCFGSKISSLIGVARIKCPCYKKGNPCEYQLEHFEVVQLRQKLDEFVLLSRFDKPSSAAKRYDLDGEEELFECRTDGCNGKWFISKSDTVNLYKCPICNINNCVHCKVVHDNMTCTDYKNTLRNRFKPSALQNMAEKLNHLVESFMPGAAAAAETRSIPNAIDNSNELLMKCNAKNCKGQWFVSKIEKTRLFKCPLCESYNCIKCNTIHHHQTCDEYKQGNRVKLMPNVLRAKYSDVQGNRNERPKAMVKPAINHFNKRAWNCKYCTFENFSFGYVCQMCRKMNNEEN